MSTPASRDPLHGITLKQILEELIAHYGFAELGRRIRIRCFTSGPSLGSSLYFLRRTPWARAEVEALYRAFLAERLRGKCPPSAPRGPAVTPPPARGA